MPDRYGHPRQSIFNRRHASAAASVSYSSSTTATTNTTTTTAHHNHHHHLAVQSPPRNPHIPMLPGQTTGAVGPPPPPPYSQLHANGAASTTNNTNNRRNLLTNHSTRRVQPAGGGVGGGMGGGVGHMIGRSRGGGGGVLAGYDGADGDEDAETLVVDEDDDDGSIVVRGVNGEVKVDEPPLLPVDDPDEIVLDMRQENEKERQRLADAVKQHQSQHSTIPAQPEEVLEVLKASLRAKVAALTEDRWMYEQEDELRLS